MTLTLGYWLGFVLLLFLYTLNLRLRGTLQRYIEVAAVALLLLVVIASFFILGWKHGVALVLLFFPLIWVLRPAAAILARQLVGFHTGDYQDSTRETAWEDFHEGRLSGYDLLKQWQEEDREVKSKLAELAQRRDIASVLAKHFAQPERLKEAHEFLLRWGLSDLQWEILTSPKELDELLTLLAANAPPEQVFAHFRD